MKTEPKIVMRDSPDAAQLVTVTGWRSRNGIFYGSDEQAERVARYAGCTHVECRDCGQPVEKTWLACRDCRAKADLAKFEAMPRQAWDGVGMLYSESLDRYYSDFESAADDLEEGQSLADLRLVICKPNLCRRLEVDDFDDLPTDDPDNVPERLEEAIEAFNKAVDGLVLSWSPGKFALQLEDATR
jgi:hypothetical protein